MRQTWLEWVAVAASIAAIALLAGFLVVDGLTAGDDPPDPVVTLRLEEARDAEHGWIVPAVIENRGDEAGEAVRLEARARVGGREETREIDVDFLPAGTEVEVEIAFSERPQGEIEVTLLGYQLP